MAPKTVLLACAEQDKLFRDVFTAQWSRARAQLRFFEPAEDGACSQEWKNGVRERIRRTDGVIALIGGYTLTSAEELWTIRCAVAEGKPWLGLWVESEHQVKPAEIKSALFEAWKWENVGDFVNAL